MHNFINVKTYLRKNKSFFVPKKEKTPKVYIRDKNRAAGFNRIFEKYVKGVKILFINT